MKFTAFLAILCLVCAVPAQDRSESAAHFKQGVDLQKAGKLEEALAEYELALKPVPHFAVLANMGIIYAQLGRFEEAVAHYEQALKLAPNQPILRLNLALAY